MVNAYAVFAKFAKLWELQLAAGETGAHEYAPR